MQFVNELPEPATGEKCVNVTIEEGRYNLSTGQSVKLFNMAANFIFACHNIFVFFFRF